MKTARNSTFALCLVAASFALSAPAAAQDSDGDGVQDIDDVAPCDPNTTMRVYVPGDRASGMMLFEDLWPAKGDFDFNDLALSFHQILNLNASGQLTSMQMDLDVLAVGARHRNGLAFHIPVPAASISSMTLTVDGTPVPASVWTTESEATVTLAPDLHALFGVVREWVNTDPNLPTHPAVRISFDVTFASGQSVVLSDAPFDLFIVDPDRGAEVHRPEYRGTSQLTPGLVGTVDDGTTGQRAFVTREGIPFALIFPELVAYPKEGVSIERLYPEILLFGSSAGAQAQLFYRNLVASERFIGQVTPTQLRTAGTPDVSCFLPEPGLCGPAVSTGHANPPLPQDLCDFGSPSAVTSDGVSWNWTCAGFYSNPTACNAPDLVCEPFSQTTCAITNGTGQQTCNGAGSGYGTCTAMACDSGFYQSGNSCLPYTYAWQTNGWGSCVGASASNWTGWSSCSASCGGGTQTRSCTGGIDGTQTRTVECYRNDGVRVADQLCTTSKPASIQSCSGGSNCTGSSSQSCNTQPCYTYNWATGGWGSCQGGSASSWSGWSGCSATCGGGTQTRYCQGGSNGTQYRSVYCRRSDGATVSDSLCGGGRPSSSQSCSRGSNCTGSSSQSCNTHPCYYYLSWRIVTNYNGQFGQYTACNVLQTAPYCGHGINCNCPPPYSNFCGSYSNGQRTIHCPNGVGDEIQCIVTTSPQSCP